MKSISQEYSRILMKTEEMNEKLIWVNGSRVSFFRSGDHFVWLSGTIGAILVMRNTYMYV